MNEAQKLILDYLLAHPKVADAWATTQGRLKGKYRMGKTGVSDIIGYLKDGRFLAIEVKRTKEPITDKQQEFIDSVNLNGGLAGIAITLEDAIGILNGN